MSYSGSQSLSLAKPELESLLFVLKGLPGGPMWTQASEILDAVFIACWVAMIGLPGKCLSLLCKCTFIYLESKIRGEDQPLELEYPCIYPRELLEKAIHQITFTVLAIPGQLRFPSLLPQILPFMRLSSVMWCPGCDWLPTTILGTREWPSGCICKEPAWKKQKQKLEGILRLAWDKGTSESSFISLAKQSKQ